MYMVVCTFVLYIEKCILNNSFLEVTLHMIKYSVLCSKESILEPLQKLSQLSFLK